MSYLRDDELMSSSSLALQTLAWVLVVPIWRFLLNRFPLSNVFLTSSH